jgi:monovalent cation/proton antiporter MnhG/PhaG subunit
VSALRTAAADALLTGGVVVTVLATWAMARVADVFHRLHLTAPVTSLGGPLIGAAFVVENGWSTTSAEAVVIVVVLAVTGPAVTMAAARVHHQRQLGSDEDAPE